METVGSMPPDSIVNNGVKVLQEKLAMVIRELTGEDATNGGVEGALSPSMDGGYGNNGGYATPGYGGGGGYGAGGTTPYGATPYGGAPSW